jgi:hypothetical protein
MRITLTAEEVAMAASVAVHRGIDAIIHNRQNNHGFKGNGWTENIEGFCAELVVAKALDVYYSAGAGKSFKGADVAENVQVRWASQDNYRLIVRPADSSDDFYVLVTGQAPTYTIKGFTSGKLAKQDKYLDNPGNGRPDAWWVPQSDLYALSLLPIQKTGQTHAAN